MASRFDQKLEQLLMGEVQDLVDGLPSDEGSEQSNEHISEPQELLPVVFEQKDTAIALNNQDMQDDYQFARSNLYGLIGRTNAALDFALKLSVLSENPRALEVAASLIRMSNDASKELINMHKMINSASQGGGKQTPSGSYTQINNNYYNQQQEKDRAIEILDQLPGDDDDEEAGDIDD